MNETLRELEEKRADLILQKESIQEQIKDVEDEIVAEIAEFNVGDIVVCCDITYRITRREFLEMYWKPNLVRYRGSRILKSGATSKKEHDLPWHEEVTAPPQGNNA